MKKKLFISILSLSMVFNLYGQDETLLSKKGKPILPEKGDFSIGMSANPVLKYAGNMFGLTGENSLDMELLNNNVIFSKYYLSSKSALRLKLGINRSTNTYYKSIIDDEDSDDEVQDKLERGFTEITFMPGIEKRKGDSRLQMFYGGEIIFGFSAYYSDYEYGNDMTSDNRTPTTTVDFENELVYDMSNRTLEDRIEGSITYGARGFVGVEYFILPKLSIGTEIGLKYVHTSMGEHKVKREYWDYSTDTHEIDTKKSDGDISDEINADILNGQIYLLFSF